jgi:hypothetical protein
MKLTTSGFVQWWAVLSGCVLLSAIKSWLWDSNQLKINGNKYTTKYYTVTGTGYS